MWIHVKYGGFARYLQRYVGSVLVVLRATNREDHFTFNIIICTDILYWDKIFLYVIFVI